MARILPERILRRDLIELGLDKEQATWLYDAIKGRISKDQILDELEKIDFWKAETFKHTLAIMEIANKWLDGFGVETIELTSSSAYSMAMLYVNMGDSYASTLIYLPDYNRFMVGSFGELAEAFG